MSDELTKIITITIQISDTETVEAYSNMEKSFIEDDLRNGTLFDMCDVVDVELTK